VADPATDLFNPHAIRSSLGTVFTVPAAVASSHEAAAFLREHGLRTFAARVDAAVSYTQADLARGAAIVLGSEAAGLSAAWGGANVTPIRLPMLGAADSLNVSAAAAVLFYEARRQRSCSGDGERGAQAAPDGSSERTDPAGPNACAKDPPAS
jgi:TrmH family RNA methyltransferase